MKTGYVMSGVAAMAMAMSAGMASAAEYKWRLTHFAPKSSTFYVDVASPFMDRVHQLMGDQIEITGFGGGELVPGFKSLEGVQDGIVDLALTTPLYNVNNNFGNSFIGGHTGGMNADALVYWLYEAGGQELITEFKRDTMGLHTLVAACNTGEVWQSHKPITKAEDFQGLKFRTAGAWGAVAEKYFGAAPVTVPLPEIYTMMERSAIDAMEFSGLAENMGLGMHEVTEYITMPAPHVRGGCFEVAWKVEVWDALPEEIQDELTAIAKLATFDALLKWKRNEVDAVSELAKVEGLTVVEPSPELIRAIDDAGYEYAYAQAELDETGWTRKIADSYYAAREAFNASQPLTFP